jgi:hypothetical protein
MAEVVHQFDRLDDILRNPPSGHDDRDYDQIVAFGEVWSTLIPGGQGRLAGVPATGT